MLSATWICLYVVALLIGFAAGVLRNRDDVIMRRRARWRRRQQGYLMWWLLRPGWRYRQ